MPGSNQPKLTVTWKITPLTEDNDPDGSRRQRQLEAILRLLGKASENTDAGNGGKKIDVPNPQVRAASAALRCSPMATDVPQRELRNNTAGLLRRVEAGERLRITVHGHPVAELVPVDRVQQFAPFDEIVRDLRGLMGPEDRLDEELRQLDEVPRDPFA
ncbi:MAG: type II toxin-antitoxin system Phd/YefM family antitoxin [Thermoleophilaceae bacterium]